MDAALLSDKKISSLFQVIERFREEYPEMPAQRNERKVRRRIELTTTGESRWRTSTSPGCIAAKRPENLRLCVKKVLALRAGGEVCYACGRAFDLGTAFADG
jgi:hypothetical protein